MLKNRRKRSMRHKRIRAKIFGTALHPRLCVFLSNNHIYAQIINDEKAVTLASANDFQIGKLKLAKTEAAKSKSAKDKAKRAVIAYEVGKLVAKTGSEKKIEKVVFDR